MERRSIHLSAESHEQLRDLYHHRRGRSLRETLSDLVSEAHRRELGDGEAGEVSTVSGGE